MSLNKIIELVLSWFNRPKLKKKRLLSSGDKLHRFLGLEAASRQTAPWSYTASSPLAEFIQNALDAVKKNEGKNENN
tara:strand:- start:236 stop:466 length:231 start_codon:yes stop_codon:yes gene_type:complete